MVLETSGKLRAEIGFKRPGICLDIVKLAFDKTASFPLFVQLAGINKLCWKAEIIDSGDRGNMRQWFVQNGLGIGPSCSFPYLDFGAPSIYLLRGLRCLTVPLYLTNIVKWF